jgi:predicted Rossmann fold nucleotide-binding protein DprA/Smf involved in DNA uptake
MERNALIYAIADAAVIVHARFKTGGTWHGAVEALRRRYTRLIVREDANNAAHRALIGLGAIPLRRPEQLAEALAALPMQPTLK